MKQHLLISFILGLFVVNAHAQAPVSGQVTDYEGNSLEDVELLIMPGNVSDFSSGSGEFSFDRLDAGQYTVTARKLGYQTYTRQVLVGNIPINDLIIQLDDDPLELSGVVVTGTFTSDSKLRASSSITTLGEKAIRRQAAIGTADLLQSIPGVFADASAGEVFTRVYSRGVAASAEDDIGWYYVGLQEDGLPVTLVNNTYYGPDFFHRTDLTVRRLEAVRGGIASVTGINSPGGIFNFISKTGGNSFEGAFVGTSAIKGDGNLMYRGDINTSGRLFNDRWSYNIGGFYRIDDGVRNLDYKWSQGGQMKFNLVKTNQLGIFKLYGKYLNDRVNRYNGLPAQNWADPEAAFGFNFSNTALMLPEVDGEFPDGRNISRDPNATLEYNPENGIQTKDISIGLDVVQSLDNDWTFHNNFKISSKKADWQTTIANQPMALDNFLPYLLSGSESPFGGNIVFREVENGNILARVNNLGAANAFLGLPTSFEYLEGKLPNDALMGIAPWKRLDDVNEWMNQLSISKTFLNHRLTVGGFIGMSDFDAFTQASYAYATYEEQPRLLSVTMEEPNTPIASLSDENGLSNYGGLLYRNGSVRTSQLALFAREEWTIQEILTIDLSARFESISHKGSRYRFDTIDKEGGVDGDLKTAYDNGLLVKNGKDDFNFTYDYTSFSIGTNFLLDEQISLFARVSNGHKAPELDYYFNNFTDGFSASTEIDRKGDVQNIFQVEGGIKLNRRKFNLLTTAFWSRLENIPFSQFVFDQQNGQIFFTDLQLNTTNTFGLEVEGLYAPTGFFNLRFTTTLQSPEATKFTVYNVGEDTGSRDDDTVEDFSGKTLPNNPGIMAELTPMYIKEHWNAFLTWRYMGERKANIANAFSLPDFHVFNLGGNLSIGKSLNLSLIINNVFNSKGLMNFFGPNEFGSNANAATFDFVQNNPDATFVVFPINPRVVQLSVGYSF